MNKSKSEYVSVVIGIILLVFGLYLARTIENPQGFMRAFPYVCIGLGSGIFGQGMSEVVSKKAIGNSIDIQKQIEIEKNDERNIAISNFAKAKAYDMMTYIFGALMICFALMGVDMIAVLLLVFAYLFVQFYVVYYRVKYDREM